MQQQSENKNICIIGGGIVGIMSAYYLNQLSQKSYNITILDQEKKMCNVSSRLNASQLAYARIDMQNFSKQPILTTLRDTQWTITNIFNLTKLKFWNVLYTTPIFITEQKKQQITNLRKLARQSFDDLKIQENILNEDIDLKTGVTFSYENQQDMEKNIDKLKNINFDKLEIKKNEKGQYLNIDVLDEFVCNSEKFCNIILNKLIQDKNITIINNVSVQKTVIQDNKVQYLETSDNKKFQADVFVFCNSYGSQQFNFIQKNVLLAAVQGLSWTIPKIQKNEKLWEKTFGNNCHNYVNPKEHVYYQNLSDFIRITYGSFINVKKDFFLKQGTSNISVLPKSTQYLLDEMEEIKPEICTRGVSGDGLPQIGKIKELENVYVNLGQSFLGWTLGCISGKILANQIIYGNQYENKEIFQCYNVNRFTIKSWLKQLLN